jgi:hypothetical protein
LVKNLEQIKLSIFLAFPRNYRIQYLREFIFGRNYQLQIKITLQIWIIYPMHPTKLISNLMKINKNIRDIDEQTTKKISVIYKKMTNKSTPSFHLYLSSIKIFIIHISL